MGKQRTLSATTKPVASTALPFLSTRHHSRAKFIIINGVWLAILLALLMTHDSAPTKNAAADTQSQAGLKTVLSAATNSPATGTTSNQPAQSKTSVTINGKSVAVPQNGTTEQTINASDGGSTSLTISHSQTSSGESLNTSVSQTSINNSSQTSISVQQNSEVVP